MAQTVNQSKKLSDCDFVAWCEDSVTKPEINLPDNWEFSCDTEAILSEEFWSSTHAW